MTRRHSAETRRRISESLRGTKRPHLATLNRERAVDANERCTATTYQGVHGWMYRNRERTNVCEDCGTKGRTHLALIAGRGKPYPPNGYLASPDPADYRECCSHCHAKDDSYARRLRRFGLRLIQERREGW